MLVPFSAGSVTDILRACSGKDDRELAPAGLVDNRPSAGIVASQTLVNSTLTAYT